MGMGSPSTGGADKMPFDTGQVNKFDKGVEGAGKTRTTQVRGERRDVPGADPYVEIKAPATTGNRTSIPYVNVLPKYRQRAESALKRDQIPKEHEKRVKEYFNGLGK